jgi:DNA mismatch endonuclease (patch repair protein)
MRAVKSRDTRPELIVRRLAHSMGYRYRLHRTDLPGKPDMVFPARKAVIFTHGCFWHGHKCKRGARAPKRNADYWAAKIARNKKRDRDTLKQLKAAGWRTLVIWECELRSAEQLSNRLKRYLG